MNLHQHCAMLVADGYQDHFEYLSQVSMLPTNRPPSLTVARRSPAQPTAQDGWHKSDSKKSKKQAREDLKLIRERLQRLGRPVVVRTTALNPQSLYSPSY